MRIIIDIVDHKNQDYDTVGNWNFTEINEESELTITVSRMNDWRYEVLVGLHEAIEAILCYDRGISEQSVTDFDVNFEVIRKNGNTEEPGDNKDAPYRKEHKFSTKIEMMICKELGIDWKTYSQAVDNLSFDKKDE